MPNHLLGSSNSLARRVLVYAYMGVVSVGFVCISSHMEWGWILGARSGKVVDDP